MNISQHLERRQGDPQHRVRILSPAPRAPEVARPARYQTKDLIINIPPAFPGAPHAPHRFPQGGTERGNRIQLRPKPLPRWLATSEPRLRGHSKTSVNSVPGAKVLVPIYITRRIFGLV